MASAALSLALSLSLLPLDALTPRAPPPRRVGRARWRAAPPRLSDFAEWHWREHWYPLAFSAVSDRERPHRLELMGEQLVLWYDGARWRAMGDVCPHRRAPLSEGRVDEQGRIECPYHGWAFEGESGRCEAIPQAEGGGDPVMLARCGGMAYPTAEKQGIIWVWGEPIAPGKPHPPHSLIPTCDALDDERFVWIDVSRDMPYSADMLLENVLDSSHVPFTHHNTISKRENAIPLKVRLTTAVAPNGFEGEQEAPPVFTGRATERTTVFRAPTYMHHRIRSSGGKAGTTPNQDDFEAGFETWTVAYATPTGPGRSRLLARFPFRFPEPKRPPGVLGRLLPAINPPKLVFKFLPDWINHLGQLKVLDDDNIFLPLQERRVAADGGWRNSYIMPTPADTYINAYRRWFDAVGPPPYAAHSVDALHGRPLDKAYLLDRYAQHTAHCTSCAGALANARHARRATKVILLAAAAVMPSLLLQRALRATAGVALVSASAMAAHLAARSVESRLTSGLSEYPPPRNSGRAAKELRTVEQGRSS